MTIPQERTRTAGWRRCRWVLLCLLALVWLRPEAAHALSTVRMDLNEMVELSEEIVHGSVVSTRSRWNDEHTLIVTEVRVLVLETLKGSEAREIQLTHPGGVVGALRVEIPGVTPFVQGQEAVLFVSRGADGNRYVTGFEQGRFDIQVDPGAARKSVRTHFLDPGELPLREDSLREDPAEDLAVFLDRIRLLVR